MSFRYNKRWAAPVAIGMAVAALATFLTTHHPKAQTLDGNVLYSFCERSPIIARGYVTGVVDALVSINQQRFCLPPTGVVKQNSDIVCKGLTLNPEYRSAPASMLTHAFLTEAFPCQ